MHSPAGGGVEMQAPQIFEKVDSSNGKPQVLHAESINGSSSRQSLHKQVELQHLSPHKMHGWARWNVLLMLMINKSCFDQLLFDFYTAVNTE